MIVSKNIRVFVSSPFQGFHEDRNALYKNVFYPLEKLCEEKGFSFQAVDLRWGISDERAINNKTARICMEEIERCQRESPRPNFLVMTGSRYGWIPMPESIGLDHWEPIFQACTQQEQQQLLASYQKDENDWNPRYHFTGNAVAQNVLFKHASKVLPLPERIYYGASMTEQEIYKGLIWQDEAKEHTIVMIRENDKVEIEEDGVIQANSAIRLQEQLRETMLGQEDNLIVYNKKDPEYWRPVYDRLLCIITDQMTHVQEEIEREGEEKLRRNERRQRLKQAAEEYIDCSNRLALLKNTIEQNKGKAIIVQGKQGTGKSLLLKKFAFETEATAVFSDLDSDCTTASQAIRKLLSGFGDMPERAPGQSLARYFEECLKRIEKPAVLILDSMDEIQDHAGFYGSLWNIKIPGNITLVMGCVDYKEFGDGSSLPCLALEGLDRNSAVSLLMEMLKREGRTLTEKQQSQLALPDHVEALYVFELCQKLRTLASYEEMKDTCKTLPGALAQEYDDKKKNYDGVFASHALACLALSSHGLQEKELIKILCSDNEIQEQIKEEEKKRTLEEMKHYRDKTRKVMQGNASQEQDFSRMPYEDIPDVQIEEGMQRYQSLEQPVMNKWASLRHGSDDFLVTIMENDIALIRCRHGLVKDICSESATVIRTMIQYFFALPDFYGKGINTRKIDELMPLLKKNNDKVKAREYLSNPYVQNAWIKVGKYDALMEYLQWIEQGHSILNDHPMLFMEEWNSFPHVYNRVNGKTFDCAYLKPERTYGQDRRLPVQGWHALRNDGLLAVVTGEQVLLYDWKQNRILHASDIEAEAKTAYWQEDELVIREETRRLRFLYKDNQLKLKSREECPSSINLYFYDDNKKIQDAGGVEEACWELKSDDYNMMWHNGNSFERIDFLYYGHSILHASRKEFACVMIDRSIIHVIHLKERKIWMKIHGLNPMDCAFSPDCKHLLVISNDYSMHMIEIEKQMEGEMASTVFTRKELRKAFFGNSFRSIQRGIGMFTCVYEHKAFPYNPMEIAGKWIVYGRKEPLLYCYSHACEWYAAYYYDNNCAYIRVFDARNNHIMLESVVDPILTVDLKGDPFSCEGTLLKIVCDGKTQVLDVLKGTWSFENKEQEDYTEFRWHRPSRRVQRDSDRILRAGITLASYIGPSIFIRLKQMVFGTGKEITQHVVKKQDGNYTWHINLNLGRITVMNKNNQCILMDETEHAVLAADVHDGKAYLMHAVDEKPLVYELVLQKNCEADNKNNGSA